MDEPNPTAVVVVVLALVLLVVAFYGTETNLATVALGHPPSWASSPGASNTLAASTTSTAAPASSTSGPASVSGAVTEQLTPGASFKAVGALVNAIGHLVGLD